jgi:hypothetical protein
MRNHYKYVGVMTQAAGVLVGGLTYLGGWEHAPREGSTPGPQPEVFMAMAQASKEQVRGTVQPAPVLPLTPSLPPSGD